ncbi:MAG: site-2 protease family protein [Chloroflexi bacterium]|nr:site-2 protease family protein [Chloroflexota bacterium]
MSTLMMIVLFVFAFGVMIFMHELGHFLMAKIFKVEVEEFGFGLPPRMVKLFTLGGTDFTLNWLPFGAFVKPKGEFGETDSDGGFKSAKPWQQLLIYLAGPVMNLLTAMVIYYILIMNAGVPNHSIVIIDKVEPGSPAEIAGILKGDRILSIGGNTVDAFRVVTDTVDQYLDKPLSLEVERDARKLRLEVIPLSNPPAGRGAMGIVVKYPIEKYNVISGLGAAAKTTGTMIQQYLNGLGLMISGKIKMGMDSIVGPVGMFSIYEDMVDYDREIAEQRQQQEATGQVQDENLPMNGFNQLSFFAIIAIALGVTNLFPIPALDGGRILFLLPEFLFRKKLPEKVEYYYNAIGMMILLILMAVIMFKDIFMLANG